MCSAFNGGGDRIPFAGECQRVCADAAHRRWHRNSSATSTGVRLG